LHGSVAKVATAEWQDVIRRCHQQDVIRKSRTEKMRLLLVQNIYFFLDFAFSIKQQQHWLWMYQNLSQKSNNTASGLGKNARFTQQ